MRGGCPLPSGGGDCRHTQKLAAAATSSPGPMRNHRRRFWFDAVPAGCVPGLFPVRLVNRCLLCYFCIAVKLYVAVPVPPSSVTVTTACHTPPMLRLTGPS